MGLRYHGERMQTIPAEQQHDGSWVDNTPREEREGIYQQALVKAWHGSGERPFVYDSCWDLSRAIDFLETRPAEFDASRIGVTGFSLGGMITWIGAVHDLRIKVSAPMCGVQGFQWAIDNRAYMSRVDSIRPVFDAAHAQMGGSSEQPIEPETVEAVWNRITPGLLEHFDAPHSLPLIAPRPLLLIQGGKDPRCPIEGVQHAFLEAKEAYAQANADDKLRLFIDDDAGHDYTAKMQDELDRWFDKYL